MTHQNSLLAAAFVFALFPAPAFGWGELGHRAMAELARQRLSSVARAHVIAVLGHDDLAAVSTWADDVRSAARHTGPLASDRDAASFNARFPRNDHWHYASLPLGATVYDDASPFASNDDVVHAIVRCVAALESPGGAEMTRAEALRMLVHLVGDLHHPLHVAEGYYAGVPVPSLVAHPASPAGLLDDRGANALFFDHERLHPYWDVTLVDRLGSSRSPVALARDLASVPVAPDPAGSTADTVHRWAAEMLAHARDAYAGIVFVDANADPRYGIQWHVRLPADYDARALPVVRLLLAEAAHRLATLLDRIRWA